MTQGFDEWFKENYPNQWAFKESTLTCKSFYDGMKIGAASRQAEIDELKNNLDFSENCVVDARHERDELQKRINEALDDLQYPTATWEETIYSVINILKGKKDE